MQEARRAKVAVTGLVRLVPARPTPADVQVAGRIPRGPGSFIKKTSKRGRRKRAGPCCPGRVVVPSARVPLQRRRFRSTPALGSFPSWFRKNKKGHGFYHVVLSHCDVVSSCSRGMFTSRSVMCRRISHLYSFPLIITAS